MSSIDQQFVEYIVKSLVSNPDAVTVERRIDEKGVLLELTVDPEDLGRVIGKRGATAQSLRTLLRALGTKNDARYNLKIVDNGVASNDDDSDDQGGQSDSQDDQGAGEEVPTANDNNVNSTDDDNSGDDTSDNDDEEGEADDEQDDRKDRMSKTRRELADLDDLDV
jgi:predicted RNA-binding protein YlqC (UPF0109 family)